MKKAVALSLLLCVGVMFGCVPQLIVKHDPVSMQNGKELKVMTKSLISEMEKQINFAKQKPKVKVILDKIVEGLQYEEKKEVNEDTIKQYEKLKDDFDAWIEVMKEKDEKQLKRFLKKHGDFILETVEGLIDTEQSKPKE